ncbi:MAG: hypothetical protein HKO57_06285, partial [Akkermansiaceae bacterium]|nr:hypothetical protein [Akkermansiaceae bacterium]
MKCTPWAGIPAAALILLAPAFSANAGEEHPMALPPPAGTGGGGWDGGCAFLDWLGTPVYDNPGGPLLQSVKFFGRAQFQ